MEPTKEYEKLLKSIFENEEILLYASSDISRTGAYTDGLAALSEKKLALFENGALYRIIGVSDMKNAVCREYSGNAALEAEIGGSVQLLARFSMNNIEMYNAASEIINDINSGNAVSSVNPEENKLCPKCGRPFIKDTKICRHCTDKGAMVKRLWKLSKPCRPLYAVLLLLFWITSMVTVFTPILKKHLVNDVLMLANASHTKLAFIMGLLLLCAVITALIEALRSVIASKASNLFVRDLRNVIYSKLQLLPLSYIEQRKTGDLMQRINTDTMRLQSFIQDIGIMAVSEAFLFVAIAIVTFSINAKMALLIFVPMPIASFLIYKIRSDIQRRYRKQWRKMDVLTSRLNDVLNGIKVVKVFGREGDEIKRFRKTAESVRSITCTNEKYVYTVFPIIRFIMGFGSYLVLLYGGSCVLGGTLSLGELVQFSAYGGYLYSKLEWFSMLPRHMSMAVASAQRVFEVLDEKLEDIGANTTANDSTHTGFRFENMSFGYKSYRRVLKNINESVDRGEMVGLVGHSGAGKSTLINLVMQLYKPSRGKIFFDGKELSSYNAEHYKSKLGVVLQESYLFSGTIFDNIRYVVPDASVEQCVEAAKLANAHDFIMNLPDGYDTMVGEKGYNLSGGERQRIAIARAILSKPEILILDEATASVDTETEEKIQQSFAEITKGRTVFAIAHRLSTLKRADRLIVLEEGRIAEKGTHSELTDKNGIYASLLQAQLKMTASAATIDNLQQGQENIHKQIIEEDLTESEEE